MIQVIQDVQVEQVVRVSGEKNNGMLLSGFDGDANRRVVEGQSEDRQLALSAFPIADPLEAHE